MKKLLLPLTLLAYLSSYSQTTVYSEDFESGTHSFSLNTTDQASVTNGENTWLVNNSYTGGAGTFTCLGFPFSFTVGNSSAQPAGITNSPTSNYMHISAQAAIGSGITCSSYIPADGTCVFAENYFTKMTSDISTSGLSNLDLSFWWMCGGSADAYGEIYYSIDGGTTWTLEQSNLNNATTWTQTSLNNPLWDNQTTLRFGFRFVNLTAAAASDPGLSIDDIALTYSCSETTSLISATACNSYTSPSGNYVWTSTNIYKDTIANTAGCDSVITIDLAINSVVNTATLSSITLTADETGATYQWLECPSMTVISSETNPSFTATTNGDYAVAITKNGCTDTSVCYSINSVGIIDNNFGNDFQIYPNPSYGNVTIDLGQSYKKVQLSITDLTGRIIQSYNVIDQQLIQCQPIESQGVYIIIIQSGELTKTSRVIIE